MRGPVSFETNKTHMVKNTTLKCLMKREENDETSHLKAGPDIKYSELQKQSTNLSSWYAIKASIYILPTSTYNRKKIVYKLFTWHVSNFSNFSYEDEMS